MTQTFSKANWVVRCMTCSVLMIASLAIFASAFARPDEANKVVDAQLQAEKNSGEPAAATSPERPTEESTATESTATESMATESMATEPVAVTGKGARIVASFTVFLLAVFVGVEVINKVPPTLHTPLMSGSNAISGITVIGALLAAGHAGGGFGAILGMIAVVLSMINVAGGFLVTHRMLMMFKKR